MMVMFQYKGKAYSFACIDEVLLDMERTLSAIDAGQCPAMPMAPDEITQYLRERKKNPQNFTPDQEPLN